MLHSLFEDTMTTISRLCYAQVQVLRCHFVEFCNVTNVGVTYALESITIIVNISNVNVVFAVLFIIGIIDKGYTAA